MCQSFEIIRGDTYNEDITISKNGIPYNLTGCTVYFTVKKSKDMGKPDTDAVIQKIITSHTNAVQGITNLSLTYEDTDLPKGDYLYDIEIVSPSGSVQSTNPISFVITTDVTKTSL